MQEVTGLSATFGIGTFLTNDFRSLSNGEKSKPLNIVIKLSSVNNQPCIKLSDDVTKVRIANVLVNFFYRTQIFSSDYWG
jgi:nicotinic acid phosphoribosyltransferase